MNKERPTELHKKIKRLKESRDGLKAHNREKSLITQRLRDRNAEIIESRDLWKAHHRELCKEFDRQKKELEQQAHVAREEAESERMRADRERERADKLQIEIETVWKKNRELENLIPKMGERAPRCWYPVLMIIICIKLILQFDSKRLRFSFSVY